MSTDGSKGGNAVGGKSKFDNRALWEQAENEITITEKSKEKDRDKEAPKHDRNQRKSGGFRAIGATLRDREKDKENHKNSSNNNNNSEVGYNRNSLRREFSSFSGKNQLLKILIDPVLSECYRAFLETNLATENLDFWVAVESWKHFNFANTRETIQEAKRILTRYCEEGVEDEVNINDDDRLKVINSVNEMLAEITNPHIALNMSVFDDAQSHIYHLMQTDLLPKFVRSDLYRNYPLDREDEWGEIRQLCFLILEQVVSFLKKYDSEEKAIELETKILSAGLRFCLLWKQKKIDRKALLPLAKPLQTLSSVAVDGFQIPSVFSPKQMMDVMREVQMLLHSLYYPHFSPWSTNDFKKLFSYLINEDLIEDFFTKRKYPETEQVSILLEGYWNAHGGLS